MAENVTYETLLTRREGARLWVTFNRPDRANALTHHMMVEICDMVDRVMADGDLRVLILRGSGGWFCAGGDLDAMAEMPPPPGPGETDPLIAPYRFFGHVLAKMNRLPQAVISIVDGPAAGGGLGMVCCSDVVITRAEAKFAVPEPRVGFIPSQVIPYITRRIGEAQMRRLAVTGVAIDGIEAARLGIAHFVCQSDEEIEARLAEVLADIHLGEPAAIAAVKRHVIDCAETEDSHVLDGAAESLIALLRRPAALDGIRAFKAKQKPPWAK